MAASAEHLPFGRPVFRAAWLSTVVHHVTDLPACAGDLRRALPEGASVTTPPFVPWVWKRWSSSGTSPAAATVAALWPTLECVVATFAEAGFTQNRIVTVREEALARPAPVTRLGPWR